MISSSGRAILHHHRRILTKAVPPSFRCSNINGAASFLSTNNYPRRCFGGSGSGGDATSQTDGGGGGGGKGRQKWTTAADCLEDHAEVFASLPGILGAYVGPHALPSDLGESIMVAVNSKNNCPYCEGLHGELARMAGVDQYRQLQAAASIDECTAQVDDPAVAFARTFADNCRAEGNGDDGAVEEAFQKVVEAHGPEKAESVRALCWFLAWGSLGGNTVNGVLFEGTRGAFPIAFAAYYAPLFGVIKVLNEGLARMPSPMPGAFFQGVGVTLTFAGGAWLTPVGLLGLLSRQTVQKP